MTRSRVIRKKMLPAIKELESLKQYAENHADFIKIMDAAIHYEQRKKAATHLDELNAIVKEYKAFHKQHKKELTKIKKTVSGFTEAYDTFIKTAKEKEYTEKDKQKVAKTVKESEKELLFHYFKLFEESNLPANLEIQSQCIKAAAAIKAMNITVSELKNKSKTPSVDLQLKNTAAYLKNLQKKVNAILQIAHMSPTSISFENEIKNVLDNNEHLIEAHLTDLNKIENENVLPAKKQVLLTTLKVELEKIRTGMQHPAKLLSAYEQQFGLKEQGLFKHPRTPTDKGSSKTDEKEKENVVDNGNEKNKAAGF